MTFDYKNNSWHNTSEIEEELKKQKNIYDKNILADKINKHISIEQELADNEMQCLRDNIKNPSHYISDFGMESIDVIESFKLDFYLGNVVKYVLRAGKKGNEVEDLKKAKQYLNRKINKLEGKNGW